MTRKTKTISLTPGFRNDTIRMDQKAGYRVERITDSLEFTPGDIITAEQAAELCDATDWKVVVARQAT